jgi:hypothetical protein
MKENYRYEIIINDTPIRAIFNYNFEIIDFIHENEFYTLSLVNLPFDHSEE